MIPRKVSMKMKILCLSPKKESTFAADRSGGIGASELAPLKTESIGLNFPALATLYRKTASILEKLKETDPVLVAFYNRDLLISFTKATGQKPLRIIFHLNGD